MNLPGCEEAKALGYNLSYYGNDKQFASYMKDGILLTVWHKEGQLEAYLELVWKLLVVKTPNFTFPCENFSMFENQIVLAKDKLGIEG